MKTIDPEIEEPWDLIVVGAGVLGLSVAYQFLRLRPGARVLVLEKEEGPALHASSRNSGVLHAGFYYSSESLKARFCREGNRAMREFCIEHGLGLNTCQKIVVARNKSELGVLENLYAPGMQNGIELNWITSVELSELEPMVQTFKKALLSPTTASVDPQAICRTLARLVQDMGAILRFGFRVESIGSHSLRAQGEAFGFSYLVNAAGAYADQLARDCGLGLNYSVLPVRGYFLQLEGESSLKTHIYPVPHAGNAFLGVHLGPDVNARIKIGPSATAAFSREHYRGFEGLILQEMIEVSSLQMRLFFKNSFGFRSLAIKEFFKGFKSVLVREARSLVHDLPGDFKWLPSGIRPQLVERSSGRLVQDFVLVKSGSCLHVLNGVSPGLTCALPFARHCLQVLMRG